MREVKAMGLASPLSSFIGWLGLALFMTAVLLPGRQSPAVINSLGTATSKIELSSLGIQ